MIAGSSNAFKVAMVSLESRLGSLGASALFFSVGTSSTALIVATITAASSDPFSATMVGKGSTSAGRRAAVSPTLTLPSPPALTETVTSLSGTLAGIISAGRLATNSFFSCS